jgi:KUP system potassium uptake protein
MSAAKGGHGPKGSLLSLSLGALGIVYGDIGTSPLYTLKECTHGVHGVPPTPDNVLGLLSLIFWSLMFVVTIKYLVFIMRADNRGEGGILALLALVPEKFRSPARGTPLLAVLVIAGAALLYGDGMITPAISVLSAVEGLEVATSSFKPFILPITCGILLGLFVIQSRGTESVGRLFGPIMLLWFLVIGGLGLYHAVQHPAVFLALNPARGLGFFAHHGKHGFFVLGSVVLAVTGGEALYADMGHFGRQSIRISWVALVLPALVLAYFGMGARLLVDPSAAENPFFSLVPLGPWTYALAGLATLATIIASQALISGAFSLTNQAIQLGFFPRVTVRHTSKDAEGQIYVPEINWLLAAACIALVLWFRESSRLAAAYGLAVTGTMGITSIVYFVVARQTWGWSLPKAGGLLVLFLAFDIPFFASNAVKFMDGGYVPVAVGAVFLLIMLVWRSGRRHLGEHLRRISPPLDTFLQQMPEPDDDDAKRRAIAGEEIVLRVPGTGVFMASSADGVPPVLAHHVARLGVLSSSVVLLTLVFEHEPYVDGRERVTVTKLGRGFVRVVARFGFMEQPDVPKVLSEAALHKDFTPDLDDVTYFLGRETFLATAKGQMGPWAEGFFSFLSRNSRSATNYFAIPPEQVLELGSQIDL